MAIASPLTPAQFPFLLRIVPIIAAWIYSEYLEYRRNDGALAKANSGIGLVELGNEAVKEDDKAILLEGGGLQAAFSPKARLPLLLSHIKVYHDGRAV